MRELNKLIKEFEATLKKYNLLNYEKLYNPLPEENLNNYLNQLGINDTRFKELFQWRNGFDIDINPNNICQIFEMDTFLSLETIARKMAVNENYKLWAAFFIPLMANSTGEYILFNSNFNSSSYGQLYLYSESLLIFEPVSCYDSISSLINITIVAYKEGIFKYDPIDDWLDINILKYNELARRLNKDAKYWTQ